MMSAMPLPPRVSRAAHVAGELEREAGGRPPGERIATKEELRERYGVALATINEAVRLLETRGLVEARPGPGGGIFVARAAVRLALMHTVLGIAPQSTTYREYLTVRDALEPLVCREAARGASPGDIEELRAIVARMDDAAGDPAAYFRHNWELHRRIAVLGGNAPLRGIYLTLVGSLETALEGAVFDVFDGPASVAVHRELVEAIARGPGPRLEAAIAAHAPLPASAEGAP
jgi:DNA-binding FadR family transcriptional regulator